MPKAKPISLHPLDFDEAVNALLKVAPEKPPKKSKAKKIVLGMKTKKIK